MNIKIVVATHKKYRMPDSSIYVPLQVGRVYSKDLGYEGDDTGENISKKNPNYCELTALYWAWKNIKADYIGLVHYRRYFACKSFFITIMQGKWEKILSKEKANYYLNHYDAILPKRRHYWIETLKSHYGHSHNIYDLIKTREIILRYYPDYLEAFDRVMNRRSAHMFNMLIMKQDLLDAYAEWLFRILEKLEKKIDLSTYSAYEARVFGYISELLMDVWLEVHPIKYKELPVMFMEKQNWLQKIYRFLKAKYRHVNYISKVEKKTQ